MAAAMERELSLLKKKLDDPAGVTFHTVGIGPDMAYREVRSLLKPAPAIHRSRAVLLLGFAGAVEPSLKPGDLILSSRYYRAESSPEGGSADSQPISEFLEPDPWMQQQAVDAVQETDLRFNPSPSLTVDRIIDSPEDKQAIFTRYSVATVNMEDYWAAAAAAEAGVPFLSVRAVLDLADQRLPGYLPALSIPGSSSVLSTLVHPWRAATLLRLAVQMRRAQWALTQFALYFIPQMTGLLQLASPGNTPDVGNPSRLLKYVKPPASFSGLAPGSTK